MADILNGILQQIGSGGLSQIAGALGADDDKAGTAIGMALPALLGAMANNASQPQGAQDLDRALQDHEADSFGSVTDLMGSEDGAKILGHVLGNKQEATEKRIAGASGLDFGTIAKLLPMLAPVVMGYLGKKRAENNLGPDDIAGALSQERVQTEEQAPGLGGLAAILDSDGDGLDIEDFTNLAGGSGGLGGLLGNILKG